MKELFFSWYIIKLFSSLGIFNKLIVWSVSPQTYTTYCVYSEEEVSDNNLAQSKHVITCNRLGCEYYQRMFLNWCGVVGGTNLIATGYLLTPFTGGLSLYIVGLVAGSINELLRIGLSQNLLAIENELKLKWENNQRERKINNLQNELNNIKRELNETIKRKNEYYLKWLGEHSANHWLDKFQEEKKRAEEFEKEIEELESQLEL